MLKDFRDDVSKGNWSVIDWFVLITLLKDRHHFLAIQDHTSIE